jgi:hypothetical protein
MVLTLDAVVNEINEHHSARKTAEFIFCPIIGNLEDHIAMPISVGVSFQKIEGNVNEFVNFIDIFYESYYEDPKERNIAVCPGTVFNKFDNALRIAEFVEIYKILGASKFYIYDVSIGENAREILKFYESEGTVEILEWNLANFIELSEENIHGNGKIAALNDCFYHATLVDDFKYFIHADFDEIIFPYNFDTLTDFLKENDSSKFHSFNFRNYFFFSTFQGDFSNVQPNAVNKFLYTQAQITRLQLANPFRVRSKYIAKASSTFEVGNHFVWKFDSNTAEFKVDTSIGALHHYRNDKNNLDSDYGSVATETNEYARKFGELLSKNVDEVCKKAFISGICPLGKNVTMPEIMIKE